MSLYLDRKYLLLSSARLRNFKQKRDSVFVFSCPICGDSSKNALKARAYAYQSKDFPGLVIYCHNCNVSLTIGHFLKHIDNQRYKEYIVEKFKDNHKQIPSSTELVMSPEDIKQLKLFHDVNLSSINQLPSEHYAREYVWNRKIPIKYCSEIFYAPDYKAFLDEFYPEHGKDLKPDDPRLVLFYTNIVGEITNVSGRSLGADVKTRYITVKITDEKKVFGTHHLDLNQKIYITEGQFDSMMLPNAIASGDSNLPGLADYIYDTFGVDCVLVFDKEPRNKQIVNMIHEAIKDDYQVCLLPETFPGKDLNEAHINGMTLSNIQGIIDKHTYIGLKAELEFGKWRKC